MRRSGPDRSSCRRARGRRGAPASLPLVGSIPEAAPRMLRSATRMVRSICVFCGSRPGADPAFAGAAALMGAAIARRGMTLVYGGAKVGLMGVLADAALAEGGKVVGVIPR